MLTFGEVYSLGRELRDLELLYHAISIRQCYPADDKRDVTYFFLGNDVYNFGGGNFETIIATIHSRTF